MIIQSFNTGEDVGLYCTYPVTGQIQVKSCIDGEGHIIGVHRLAIAPGLIIQKLNSYRPSIAVLHCTARQTLGKTRNPIQTLR